MRLETYLSEIEKKKSPVIIILFLFIVCFAHSQSSFKDYQIKGRLIDEATGNPISYANIALYMAPENNLVGGKMTPENGEFRFNDLKAGIYQLKITFIGYKEFKRDSIVINSQNPEMNLGDIRMQTESKLLNEVNVVGDRLKGEELVDRTVYNINLAIVKSSSNGMDVLKRIPTLQVDAENNITLEGSGNILIYVDGKETNREYVYSLNPQLIDKIEVINNPSAKYDAAITGVINIILKHQTSKGGTLSISTEIPVSETYNSDHSINLTYNYKKFAVELSTFGYHSKWNNDRYILRESWMEDTTRMLQTGGESPSYSEIQPSLTLGYYFNKKNALHLYVQTEYDRFYKTQYMDRDEDSITYLGTSTKSFTSDKSFDWNYFKTMYSLFYKKTFNKPETELIADITYINWRDKGYDFNEDWPVTDLSTSEIRKFTTKNHETVLFGKLDFSTKIANTVKLETGYAFSDQKLDNDLSGSVKTFDNQLVPAYDTLKYDEIRNAGYLSFSGTINKFNWMAGFRLENSDIFINIDTKAGYTCLLPNISLQQKLKDKNSIKLSYRRRIVRPQSQHLNPFLKKNEKMTYEQGDPSINPSYVNSFKFSYNYSFGKSMIIPQLFFNYNQDNINRIFIDSNDGIITKSYKNGGDSYSYGAELSGQLQLFKWWTLNPYFSLGEAYILGMENDKFQIKSQSDMIWYINMSSVMTFYNDLNIIVDYNFRSPFISPQTRTYRDPYYSIRIEKGIFKQKAKIGIDVFTPFTTHFVANKPITSARDKYQNFTQTDESKLIYNYRIMLKFSYNLKWGEMENKININRSDINEGRGGGF